MKRLLFLALLGALVLVLAGCGTADEAEQGTGEAAEVVQRDVLGEGLAAAQAAGLPLLIDVYSDS